MTRDEIRDLLRLQFEQFPNPLGISTEMLWDDDTYFYIVLVHNEEDPVLSNFFRTCTTPNSLRSRLHYDPRYERESWERWFSGRFRTFNIYLADRIRFYLRNQQEMF